MSVLDCVGFSEGARVEVLQGDLSEEAYIAATHAPCLPWDTETTGLDYRTESLATVQVFVDSCAYVVQMTADQPRRLKRLLEDSAVRKVMHHAMFDLRFMAFHWDAHPSNVACTKIASKLARPDAEVAEHSLAALTTRFLDVSLDKGQRTSDWAAETLDPEQLRYAAGDVVYLPALYERLDDELHSLGRAELRDDCYRHLPTRVQLELGGFPDVYTY